MILRSRKLRPALPNKWILDSWPKRPRKATTCSSLSWCNAQDVEHSLPKWPTRLLPRGSMSPLHLNGFCINWEWWSERIVLFLGSSCLLYLAMMCRPYVFHLFFQHRLSDNVPLLGCLVKTYQKKFYPKLPVLTTHFWAKALHYPRDVWSWTFPKATRQFRPCPWPPWPHPRCPRFSKVHRSRVPTLAI